MTGLHRRAAVGVVAVLGLGIALASVGCASPSATSDQPGGTTTGPASSGGTTVEGRPGGGVAIGAEPIAVQPEKPSLGAPASSGASSSSGVAMAMPAPFYLAPDFSSYSYPQPSFPAAEYRQEGIWVTGVGRATMVPDVGLLNLRVEAQEKTVVAAREKAAAAMRAILDALKGQGVADKDIQTQYFNIQPIYHYEEAVNNETGYRYGKQVLDGYQVTNSITVKVRDLARFDDAIDSAVVAGGDFIRIDSVGLTVDDPSKAQAEARTTAMKDAMAHAQQLAEASGVTLGKLIFVTESGGMSVPQRAYAEGVAYAKAAADVAQPTPIQPGEMEFVITVQAIFAIL